MGNTYITTPLIETTAVVCELYVLDPDAANVFHEDQGPLRLVAVLYILSFGSIFNYVCQSMLAPPQISNCLLRQKIWVNESKG